MPRHPPSAWSRHLREIASPVAVRPPPARPGQVEVPFAAVACGVPAGPAPSPLPAGEVGLWWALADDRLPVENLAGGDGPLWPDARRRGLEVWTDAELSGLHALWRLARRRDRADWARRAEAARDWHLANTQPDNATNRPWALHVFLLAGDSAEAYHYAEVLLHNALATARRPDLLSAWILLDCADCLTGPCTRGDRPPSRT